MKRYGAEHDRMKREVRRLVRSGLSKADASRVTKVRYPTVILWTLDMPTCKGKKYISGMTLRVLREIVSNGYMFATTDVRHCYKTLTRYLPLRRVTMGCGSSIIFLEGRGREAMEAFLKKMNMRSFGWKKLDDMRRIFGIKKLKRDNKIRGGFS